ncbi:MAG: adenosylcobinamide-GDP ribazoletransferase [Clostridia bacterium]|nr:adenosylcobinamide-GDP ribazoletransferase [Clostridia bacterium]
MKSLIIAVAMYSKLPTPRVDWDKKSLSWALCFFPLVGAVIGLLLAAWLALADCLNLGRFLTAAGALALPVAVSGGIHLDGFCDTCDAMGSHQTKEKKLEILKDTHAGAFAILCCVLYLIFFFAVWCEADSRGAALWVLALTPVLSRCLSGLAAVSWKNARGTGLLATFTEPMDAKKAKWVLLALSGTVLVALAWIDPLTGLAAGGAAVLTFFYYRVMSTKQFGGITGDLAGFFLQVCECTTVLAVVLAQKGAALL